MRKRNILKIFCLLSYISLVILFFIYPKVAYGSSDQEQEPCIQSECLKLCNSEQNSKFLNETLEDFETNISTNLSRKYQVLNGSPCEKMKVLEKDQWKFSSVSERVTFRKPKNISFFCVQSGSISVNDTSFSESKYCLEWNDTAFEENANETEWQWSLMVCDDNSILYEQLHAICMVVSAKLFRCLINISHCSIDRRYRDTFCDINSLQLYQRT